MKTRFAGLAAAMLALAAFGPGAQAAKPAGGGCDRACLEGLTNQYLDALVAHDVKRAPVAKGARFTENTNELKLGDGNKRLRFELNLLNAFNQKTSRHEFNFLNRGAGAPRQSSSINLSNVDLSKGYDYTALINASADGANAYDPRYGKDDLFEPGTQGYFTVRFLF